MQLDRLGYTPLSAVQSSSSQQSSSTIGGARQSPYRDTQSPSRILQQQSTTAPRPNYATSTGTPYYTSTNNNNNNNSDPLVSSTTTINSSGQSTAVYKFNMSEFRPEDIAITVTDTTLKVHAVREESDQRGAGKTYREFKREIGLPQGADVKRYRTIFNLY